MTQRYTPPADHFDVSPMMREFSIYWAQRMSGWCDERTGQSLYNSAWYFSDVTRMVCYNVAGRALLDPFHKDDNIDNFLNLIREVLK